MKANVVKGLLSALLCLLGVASVHADEYADRSGFSFTYPESWRVVADPSAPIKDEQLPPEFERWLDKNKAILAPMKVLVIKDVTDQWSPVLYVTIIDRQISAHVGSLKLLIDIMPDVTRNSGVPTKFLHTRLETIGERDAIVMETESRVPGLPGPVRNKQVFFPGGGKTFLVTCSCRPEDFEDNVETFDAILKSFKVPEPIYKKDPKSKTSTAKTVKTPAPEKKEPAAVKEKSPEKSEQASEEQPEARERDFRQMWYVPVIGIAVAGLLFFALKRLS